MTRSGGFTVSKQPMMANTFFLRNTHDVCTHSHSWTQVNPEPLHEFTQLVFRNMPQQELNQIILARLAKHHAINRKGSSQGT